MKERPIILSTKSIRDILDDNKTMIRQVVRHPQGSLNTFNFVCKSKIDNSYIFWSGSGNQNHYEEMTSRCYPNGGGIKCPYGVPGDRLWVKECFGFSHQADDVNCREQVIVYRAGYPYTVTDMGVEKLKRLKNGQLMEPNHFVPGPKVWYNQVIMPRWAARLMLEIVEVRVERLQDISEDDCLAEGVNVNDYCDGYKAAYSGLWEATNNKKPGCSWHDNPWVWVVKFKKIL